MVVVLTGYNRNSKFDLVANGPSIFIREASFADGVRLEGEPLYIGWYSRDA